MLNLKIQRYAYLCNGKPPCHNDKDCGIKGLGLCTHTTDISYAQNRKILLFDDDYRNDHMIKVADSDTEEWFFEEVVNELFRIIYIRSGIIIISYIGVIA